MTEKNVLFTYRLRQAEETYRDAKKMLAEGLSPRSIINRAYYSIFYSVLALFLHSDLRIKTSKHIGIIATFDKEFIQTRRIDRSFSRILHKTFEARQEADYWEFVESSDEDAARYVQYAENFLNQIKSIIAGD